MDDWFDDRTRSDPDDTDEEAWDDEEDNAIPWVELAELAPDVVLRADDAAVQTGATPEVRGAPAVAETFKGRARFAQPALIDGTLGAVWAPGGRPRVVFGFTIARGKIVAIDLLADPARLGQLELVILND